MSIWLFVNTLSLNFCARDKLTVQKSWFQSMKSQKEKRTNIHIHDRVACYIPRVLLILTCPLYAQVCIHHTLGSRSRPSFSRALSLLLPNGVYKVMRCGRILSISFANAFSYKETRRGNRKGRKDGPRARSSRVRGIYQQRGFRCKTCSRLSR